MEVWERHDALRSLGVIEQTFGRTSTELEEWDLDPLMLTMPFQEFESSAEDFDVGDD